MIKPFLKLIQESQLKADLPEIKVGDRIEVHQRLLDGAKERVQVFEGDVIAIQNGGVSENLVIRRIVQGEGIERIIPVHSPRVVKFVVKKAGSVRRAKLYYLRDRVGKATKIKEDKKRQVRIDTAAAAAAVETAKAAAAAAKAAQGEGGESKSAKKKAARKEAAKAAKK